MLFDIDGTLMRGAGRQHKDALIDGIRKVTGRMATFDGIATAGTLDRDLIAAMLRAQGESERRIRSILRETMRQCEESYLENCTEDLSPFLCRGVPRVLEVLKSQGAVMGLVTGNLTAIGWKKMELAGIGSYFSTGAFAEHGRTRARLAQVARRRARRVGLIERESRVSLIGDHTNDVAAAKANGFQSIAVATGVVSFEDLARSAPDILVHHLEELDLRRLL